MSPFFIFLDIIFGALLLGYVIHTHIKDEERDGALFSPIIFYILFVAIIICVLHALLKFSAGLCEGNIWPGLFRPNPKDESLRINCYEYVIAVSIPLAFFVLLIIWNGLVLLYRLFLKK